MSIQTLEDEKITDFVHGMTDAMRSNNLGLYFLLINSTLNELYSFAMQPTSNIMMAIRLR
jgi:hypothetical protein